MVDLRYLLDFLDLARSGNFSATARNRSISQPALTRRMQQLEEWAGRLLFDRSSTPLKLTSSGEEFRPIAARIVEELEAFSARSRQAAERPIRCMSIHCLGAWVSRARAGDRVAAISFGTYDRCFAALREGDIDLALVCHSDGIRDARFRAVERRAMGCERFVPVASVDCVAKVRVGAPCTVVELARDNYLGNALAAVTDRCKRQPGHAAGPVATRIDALRALVMAGAGMGWLPESMIAGELESGQLLALDGATTVRLDIVLIAVSREKLDAGAQIMFPDRDCKPSAPPTA